MPGERGYANRRIEMMKTFPENIRPNFAGDYPNIDASALIDPSAQIIGNVRIGKNFFVGPLAVIRADERGRRRKDSSHYFG